MSKSAEFKRLREKLTEHKTEVARKRFLEEGFRIIKESYGEIVLLVGCYKVSYFPFTEKHTDFNRGYVRGLENFINLCKK